MDQTVRLGVRLDDRFVAKPQRGWSCSRTVALLCPTRGISHFITLATARSWVQASLNLRKRDGHRAGKLAAGIEDTQSRSVHAVGREVEAIGNMADRFQAAISGTGRTVQNEMVEDAISRQRDPYPVITLELRLPGPAAEIGRQAFISQDERWLEIVPEWLGLTEWQEVGGVWPPRVGGGGHPGRGGGKGRGGAAQTSRHGVAGGGGARE